MKIYTAVDEGFSVSAYTSAEKLVDSMIRQGCVFVESEGAGLIKCTKKELIARLRKTSLLRLWADEDDLEWTYRIESHKQ